VTALTSSQLIAELADTVAACLLDITDLSAGLKVEKPAVNDLIFSHQIATERSSHTGPFHALEGDLRRAVAASDEAAVRDIVKYSDSLALQWGSANVNRILWRAIIDAPADLADLILSCPAKPFDLHFVDDVSGRTCLHEAVMANAPRLVDLCLREDVDRHKLDVYGRSALHYSCLSPSGLGSTADQTSSRICQTLLEASLAPDTMDLDNYSPLLYAVLRGGLDRVRILLDLGHVSVTGTASNGDLIPLSLACQVGNVGVVLLLLERDAACVANTNGEYPMHLAAREGHADVCRLLIGRDGWDTPDKYNDWTPLFHAARHGRTSCLQVLLEAGSQTGIVDEFGNTAVYYAAWNGHRDCVSELLQRMPPTVVKRPVPSTSHVSPLALSESAAPMSMDDLELIPSLALPPPIMPYRVYGHNFLDRSCLVQVILGARDQSDVSDPLNQAIRLHPKLSGIQSRDRYMHASPFLKLVIVPGPDSTSAPHSVALPLPQGSHVYTFQVPSADRLSLEFTLYPHHGTKTVGRAIALPSSLKDAVFGRSIVVPILDHRLHTIGEVSSGTCSLHSCSDVHSPRYHSRSTSYNPSLV
jgi:CDK inhibitor PHO81